jgi:hypothetical protein
LFELCNCNGEEKKDDQFVRHSFAGQQLLALFAYSSTLYYRIAAAAAAAAAAEKSAAALNVQFHLTKSSDLSKYYEKFFSFFSSFN